MNEQIKIEETQNRAIFKLLKTQESLEDILYLKNFNKLKLVWSDQVKLPAITELAYISIDILQALVFDYLNFVNNKELFSRLPEDAKKDLAKKGLRPYTPDIYTIEGVWDNSALKQLCQIHGLDPLPVPNEGQLVANYGIQQLLMMVMVKHNLNGLKKPVRKEDENIELDEAALNAKQEQDELDEQTFQERTSNFNQKLIESAIPVVDSNGNMDFAKLPLYVGRNMRTIPSEQDVASFKLFTDNNLKPALTFLDSVAEDFIKNIISNFSQRMNYLPYFKGMIEGKLAPQRVERGEDESSGPKPEEAMPRPTTTSTTTTNPALKRPIWADQQPKSPTDEDKK